MSDRSIAAVCAAGLFVVAVAIGLAGADKPPPLGFLWLVGILAVLCAGVFVWLQRKLAARAAGVRVGLLRVAAAGLAAGVVAAVVLSVISHGEPSISVPVASRLLGLVVAGVAGMALAFATWLVAAHLQQRLGRR
jgi:hypothetical protein